jgi:hypothetical protein
MEAFFWEKEARKEGREGESHSKLGRARDQLPSNGYVFEGVTQ